MLLGIKPGLAVHKASTIILCSHFGPSLHSEIEPSPFPSDFQLHHVKQHKLLSPINVLLTCEMKVGEKSWGRGKRKKNQGRKKLTKWSSMTVCLPLYDSHPILIAPISLFFLLSLWGGHIRIRECSGFASGSGIIPGVF